MQIVDPREQMVVELEENIALHQTGTSSSAAIDDLGYHHRIRAKPVETPGKASIQRDRLRRHTKLGTPNASIAHKTRSHVFSSIASDRKTDALGRARHSGIDADDETSSVDQRAAR